MRYTYYISRYIVIILILQINRGRKLETIPNTKCILLFIPKARKHALDKSVVESNKNNNNMTLIIYY